MFGAPLDDASCRLLGLLNARLGSPNAAAVTAAATGGLGLPTVSTPPYRCLVCFAAFPSPWLLRQHTALQHASIVLPQPGNTADAGGEEKPFVCEQCGQSYRYRSAYLKHREQNHRARLPADKLFACDVCGMQFRYLKSFKKHRLNHALERLHGRGSSSGPAGSASGGYGSDVESRPVPQLLSSVRAPAATDTGTDEVSSTNETVGASNSNEDNELCPKIKQEQPDQSSVNEYQTEEETTNKEMKKSPEECDQDNTIDSVSVTASTGAGSVVGDVSNSFQQQIVAHEASLLNLLQSDVGADRQRDRERRFACPFCGKCVRSKENLKLHVRKHTGERPFVCLFCGRAFGGKSDLTRHLRIHTGERPYHCDMCGKCFARADYLSKHLTTHMHTPR